MAENFIKEVLQHLVPTNHNLAIWHEGQFISYADLFHAVQPILSYLQTHTSSRQLHIGIFLESPVDRIIAMLAITLSGHCYIPFEPGHPIERLRHMCTCIQIDLMLTDCLTISILPQASFPIITWEALASHHQIIEAQMPGALFLNNDWVYILYTSGSTGQPKASALYFEGVNNLLCWYVDAFNFMPRDKVIIVSAFSFDLTHKNIWSALMAGATIYLTTPLKTTPNQIASIIHSELITHINCTPSLFYLVLNQCNNIDSLGSLKYILLGGETIHCQKIKCLSALYPRTQVVNTYGPTECSDLISTHTLTREELLYNQSSPLGKALPGINIHILDENMCASSAGKLYISGKSLGAGYLNDKKMTEEKFPNYFCPITQRIIRLYDTGDMVSIDSSGLLHYYGRTDDQIKLRGQRLTLGEIEAALQSLEQVSEAVACVIDCDEKPTLACVLVLYSKAATHIAQTGVTRELIKKLPYYMIPTRLIIVDELPRNAHDKVDRQLIQKLFDTNNPLLPPASSSVNYLTEVCKIMAGVLALPTKDIHENTNFFDSGGYSITGTEFLLELNQKYSVNLNYGNLLTAPTPGLLAKVIQSNKNQQSLSKNLPLVKNSLLQATPFQTRVYHFCQKLQSAICANLLACYRIEGAFSLDQFNNALYKLINRHIMLRAYFEPEASGKFLATFEPLNLEEVVSILSVDSSSSIDNILSQAGTQSFQLTSWPLFKVKVIIAQKNIFYLVFICNHTVMDGYSWQIFIKELSLLYQNHVLPPLPELKMTAHTIPDTTRIADLHTFLQEAGVTEAMTKYQYNLNNLNAIKLIRVITPDLLEKLNNVAKSKGLNLFALLLASYQWVLKTVLGYEGIVVFPFFNKSSMSQLDTIVPTITALPSKPLSHISDSPWIDTAKVLQAYLNKLYQMLDIPIEQVITLYKPLFLFGFHNYQLQSLRIPACQVTPIFPKKCPNSYALQVHIWPDSMSPYIEIIYNPSAFDGKEIEQLIIEYLNHLETVSIS